MHFRRMAYLGRAHRDPDTVIPSNAVLASGRTGHRGMKTPSAWIRRLAFCGALSLEEQRALDEASANSRAIPGHEAIAKAGAECGRLFVVLDGLACRFKLLP